MARRRVKRKKLTITERFNRIGKAMEYLFGIEFSPKKRATSKQLKSLQKENTKLRKQERAKGVELPTIAQVNKLLKQEQEAPLIPTPTPHPIIEQPVEELEPLNYAGEESTLSSEDVNYPIIDEFKSVLEDITSEAESGNYHCSPQARYNIVGLCTKNMEKLSEALDLTDNSTFADFLSQSDEYQTLVKVIYKSYEEVLIALDDMIDWLQGIINSYKYDYKSNTPKTFPNGINLDNI